MIYCVSVCVSVFVQVCLCTGWGVNILLCLSSYLSSQVSFSATVCDGG